uniref:CDC42 small effector 1 n=1 Tax=Aquila chrysaetos chrysaetos TaxID=223781 RepID=A0A663DPJ6_AQUCH
AGPRRAEPGGGEAPRPAPAEPRLAAASWAPAPAPGPRTLRWGRAVCSSPRRASLTRSPHPSPWSDPAWGSLHRRGSPRQLARHGGKLAAANMSDFWHKLGCCVVEKPQPKKRRRRIDRSMIGEPMNFIHLTHIGSGDMAADEGLPMVPYPCEQLGWWVSWLGGGCCFCGAGSHGCVV